MSPQLSRPISAGIAEHVLRAMLRSPEHLAYPLKTDVGVRPLTVEAIPPRRLDRLQKGAGGALAGMTLLFIVLGLVEGNVALVSIALVLALLVGVVFLIVRARANMVWRIDWRQDGVEVADGRWGRNARWYAPYDEFAGVSLRRGYIQPYRSRSTASARPIEIVELVHEDPDRTVLLESGDPSPLVEERARANARHLGVPYLGRRG